MRSCHLKDISEKSGKIGISGKSYKNVTKESEGKLRL